jgi:hypothetical protein
MTLDIRKLAVVITGRPGHRGSQPAEFLRMTANLKRCFTKLHVSWVTSDDVAEDVLEQAAAIFDRIDILPYVANTSKISPLYHSIVIQTSQVSLSLSSLPPEVEYVVRLRSDWLITNPREFIAVVERMRITGEFGHCSYSGARFPVLPIPYFMNDQITFGTRSSMAKFWSPFSPQDFINFPYSKFWSKSFFFFSGATTLMPEQILWARFWNLSQLVLLDSTISKSLLASAWEASANTKHVPPLEMGVLGYPQLQVEPRRFAAWFYGPIRSKQIPRSKSLKVQILWLIANYAFFLHPHWIASRTGRLAFELQKKRILVSGNSN